MQFTDLNQGMAWCEDYLQQQHPQAAYTVQSFLNTLLTEQPAQTSQKIEMLMPYLLSLKIDFQPESE